MSIAFNGEYKPPSVGEVRLAWVSDEPGMWDGFYPLCFREDQHWHLATPEELDNARNPHPSGHTPAEKGL